MVLSKEALDLLVFYNDVVLEGVKYKSCELLQSTAVPRALAYF